VAHLWLRLTDAPASVTDPERRRQVRLLAGLMLVLVPLGFLSIVIQALLFPNFWPTFQAVTAALLLLSAAYGLARAGHFIAGALIAVSVSALASFAIVLLNPADAFAYAFLYIGIFLAALLFAETGVWITATADLLGVSVLLPAWGVAPPQDDPVVVPMFLVIVSALLLLSIRHRDAVERDRRAQLAASEARHREAQRLAKIGSWELDLANDRLAWSDEIYRIFEIDPAKFGASYAAFLQAVHPDDREAVNRAYTESVRQRTAYDIVHRLRMPDGRVKYAHERGETAYDEHGRALRSVGTVQDISAAKRAEERLLEIARGVSAATGELFFHSLVEHLARVLEADYAFVGELVPGYRDRIRTIAMQAGGAPAANIEYDLAGTPCQNVFGQQSCAYPSDVRRLFPADHLLADMGIEAYVGTPLFNSAGRSLGLLVVLFRRPIALSEPISSTLQIFAARAAAELERVRAEQALVQSESNFRALTENANVGILVNHQGRHVYANNKLLELLGYTADEIRATGVKELVHPAEYDQVMVRFRDRLAGRPAPGVYETVFVTKDGQPVPVELTAARTTWHGESAGLVFLHDLRERRRTEAQMRKLSGALEQIADSVMITDRNGGIEYVNPAFERSTGYTRAEALGQTPRITKSGKQGAGFYKKLWQTILAGEVFSEVLVNRRKDGSLYYEEKTITPLKDIDGRITHFIATGKDVTERMQTQERLEFMAQHDALTALPNRALFMDRLRQALARARWHRRIVAVLFVDMDRFKTINDTLGHEAGDELLQRLGERFNGSVREGDTVARFGGDEFVILLDDVASENDIRNVAQKVLDALAPPFEVGGQRLFITASIGVSLAPNDGEDSGTLLKNADIAMYRAKELGKNTYQFYSADMSARAFERLTLESSLRHALERGELRLHYQPQVDVRSGRIVGVEALLRWQHPEFGLVPPGDFVPLLEETGLIVPAGEWVLDTACAQLAAWHAAGWPELRLAVNLSPRQFHAGGLAATIERCLACNGRKPGRLELEITEGVILEHARATLDTLEGLHAHGVRLAVDDFGTGYSSLSYLQRFPIDTLKIDRSFVQDIPRDPDDSAITAAIIVMAQSLKLEVVAEGVESATQRDFLHARGCHVMQGFLFSRPLPAADVTRLLEKS
jgi:diguanylate cyclase (GGDEF)-like protein/PAS domain S-box-containing protein